MYPSLLVVAGILSVAQGSAFVRLDQRHAHNGILARQDPSAVLSSPPAAPPAAETTVATTSIPEAQPTPQIPTTTTTTPAVAGAPTTTGPLPPVDTLSASGSTPVLSTSSAPISTPSLPTMTVATHAPGESPPISGAPVLPAAFIFTPGKWPTADRVPETNSPEVASWMKELEGHDIPNITPTVDGTCGGDPAAAADSANRGWWTCGGVTRDTDIVACPDKLTWGVSFDDGPGEFTPNILDYLKQKALTATFFVVGSRVIERPAVLIEEYMTGNEISVHTWSHSKPLTSLSTEQIVAELGWTRKAIKQVLGVTPTTMRPPWGDIDDRVRAISLAMGLIPIMWTRAPSGVTFDTNDWKVPAGTVTVDQSIATFNDILGNATTLNTGFIVLQHDIHEVTVEMAMQKTLNAAMTHNPPFAVKRIGECMKYPPSDLYRETTKNTTFPYPVRSDAGGVDIDGDSSVEPESSVNSSGAAKKGNGAFSLSPSSALPCFMTALLLLLYIA